MKKKESLNFFEITSQVVTGVITRTLIFVVGGIFFSWGIVLFLLPKFGLCGLESEAALKCVIVLGLVLFFLVILPFLFFWFGKDYAFSRAFYSIYDHYKEPITHFCAQKLCDHREVVLAHKKVKSNHLFKELPLVARMMLSRINFSEIALAFKQNPQIKVGEVEKLLQKKLERDWIHKPKMTAFWVLCGMGMLVLFVSRSAL